MSKNGPADDYAEFDLMEDELYTELDDDRRAELDQLIGLKVLGVELYEDSLGDDEEESPVSPDARVFFDCDLYLEDNQALELYVTSAYPDPDADPVVGLETIFDTIGRLADEKMALVDYGEADEEGGLALAFGRGDKVEMVLVCSAWMVSEWEAEGEEEDSEEA